MRIAYACYVSAFAADGVNQKISTQLAHWRSAGHQAELFCLSPRPSRAGRQPQLSGHLFTYAGQRQRVRSTVALARSVRRFAPDLIYLRHDIFVPPVWAAMGAIPVAIEINTDDAGEALSGQALGELYHKLTRGLILRAAAGFVCVTHELARSPRLIRFNKPTVVIANGAGSTDTEPLPPADAARAAGAMLIGYPASWTGVDKAVALARALPEIDLHLVGEVAPEPNLPANVILHGQLSRDAYRQVLSEVDFGLGPLALHRKGMAEASPLKVREYLMHGLPVLAAYNDTDFLDEDRWFLLRLPNREGNIEASLSEISAWIDAVRGRRILPAELNDRLAIETKESARLRFLEGLVGSRGARKRHDRDRLHAPAGLRTPPLKPRPYYQAVDVIQRVRAQRAMRERPSSRQLGVRILAYHRVADDGDVLAVRRDAFRRQMEAVAACGAEAVRLDAVPALLRTPIDRLYVCVTFDDGYQDALDHAAPILRELGIPATVFLPTAITDGRMTFDWYRGAAPPALDWEGVAELIADGSIDVQSHSRTHPRLPALDDRQLYDELAGSKRDIERHVGQTVSSFCYPAGLYGAREARLVLEAGYLSAVTCRSGLNRTGADPTQLLRTLVGWGDDVRRFQAKLAGLLDRPSRLTEAMQRRRAGVGDPLRAEVTRSPA